MFRLKVLFPSIPCSSDLLNKCNITSTYFLINSLKHPNFEFDFEATLPYISANII